MTRVEQMRYCLCRFCLSVFVLFLMQAAAVFSYEGASDVMDHSGWGGRVWELVRGRNASNAVYMGMWSTHFFSNSDYRTTHNLVGLQYNGYFVGTFANSHSHQVFVAGVARTVARKELGDDWVLEAGYKLGPMYGYRRGIPEYHRFSVLPLACFGVSFRQIGFEVNLVPSNSLSFSTHIRF